MAVTFVIGNAYYGGNLGAGSEPGNSIASALAS